MLVLLTAVIVRLSAVLSACGRCSKHFVDHNCQIVCFYPPLAAEGARARRGPVTFAPDHTTPWLSSPCSWPLALGGQGETPERGLLLLVLLLMCLKNWELVDLMFGVYFKIFF